MVPLCLALPPLYWVVEATRRACLAPLGRDQGIFQYIGWAIAQGQRDYRDVRDVNGPLTHLVHRVFLALGGADDLRFHVLDLVATGLSFAVVGACLPGLRDRAAPSAGERAAWALASWVILSGQYLLYGYWDIAQRESFFDWFMLPSIGLQLVAQSCWSRGPSAPWRLRLLALSGALSVVPWFGKPTYGLFTMAQILTLAIDVRAPLARGRALRAFAAGGAVGAALPGGWLVLHGDLPAYLRIQLVDVPAMYRFIWPRAVGDIFSNPWDASQAIFALTGPTVLLSLVVLGEMPARVVAPALVPVAALGNVVAQAKGFPYHFHPVTAGTHLQWLVLVAWLAERTRVARRDVALVRLVPLAAAVVFALHVATSMEDSPHIRAVWTLWGANRPADRTTREYFAHFPETDFFPYELRQTSQYLRAATAPADRVQIYGMDPYVLFLAQRLSATPYIYVYDLDGDAALAGGTGGAPDDAQKEHIRTLVRAHESDLVARLVDKPPAAFVFLDNAPLMSDASAWDDYARHCPRAADWTVEHYRETAVFGHNHIWLRHDLSPPGQLRPDDPYNDAP